MPESRHPLFLGDFHPHLEEAFAARLRALGPRRAARELTVVVPNRLLAVHLRRRAAALGAPSLGLKVTALEDLIARLAAPEMKRARQRPLPTGSAPLLLAEVLAPHLNRPPLDQEGYFSSVADKPGLYRALAGTLRDLRDAGVGPEALTTAASRAFASGSIEYCKLSELADHYRWYLEALASRRLADGRRQSELAAAALAAQPEQLPRLFWLYGFYDLVARQRDFLRQAFQRRQLVAFFPWGQEASSFAFAAPMRAWLEGQGFEPQAGFEQDEEGMSALGRLRSALFALPAPGAQDHRPIEENDRSVRFLSTPEPSRQATEVVRELVARRPRSAAVLLRQESTSAPYYRALAEGRLHLPAGEPWRRYPAARALAVFLDLARARRGERSPAAMPRAMVEDLLGTGALFSELFEVDSSPARWPQLMRRLGLVADLSGWERLARRDGVVDGVVDDGVDGEPTTAQAAESSLDSGSKVAGESAVLRPAEEAESDVAVEMLERELRQELPALARWVQRLLAASEEMAAEVASWRLFARRLWKWIEGWLQPGAERAELLDLLVPLAELDGVLRPSFSLAVEMVEQLLDNGRRGGPRFGDAPTVGDLMSLRGITFDEVFVPDLIERTFPRRPRQDPILLDDERAALNRVWSETGAETGRDELALSLKVAGAASEEKLLFRLAVGAARRSLVLAWPRAGADGRTLVPSIYLLTVANRLLGPELGARLLQPAPLQPDSLPPGVAALRTHWPLAPPYPQPEQAPPLAAWEIDLAAIDAASEGGQAGELSYLVDAYPRFAESLALQEERWGFAHRHRLSEFDGLIGARLGSAWLASRSRHGGAVALSASALERYARCSFSFFQHDILGLRSESPPERRLDQDPRLIGHIYHALLHALFVELDEEGLLPLGEEGLPAARELLVSTLERLVAANPRWIEEGPEVLWQARRRRLLADLRRLLELEVATATHWLPLAYEVGFGGRGERIPQLELGGHRLALRGRIDRVDRGGDRAHRVVDYKTGRMKPAEYRVGDLRRGERLQLALYARALPQVLDGVGEVHGSYVGVTSANHHASFDWSAEDFARCDGELDRLVEAILTSLGRGELHQVERGFFCEHLCQFSSVCGPGRRRLIEDKSEDPRVAEGWRMADERAGR